MSGIKKLIAAVIYFASLSLLASPFVEFWDENGKKHRRTSIHEEIELPGPFWGILKKDIPLSEMSKDLGIFSAITIYDKFQFATAGDGQIYHRPNRKMAWKAYPVQLPEKNALFVAYVRNSDGPEYIFVLSENSEVFTTNGFGEPKPFVFYKKIGSKDQPAPIITEFGLKEVKRRSRKRNPSPKARTQKNSNADLAKPRRRHEHGKNKKDHHFKPKLKPSDIDSSRKPNTKSTSSSNSETGVVHPPQKLNIATTVKNFADEQASDGNSDMVVLPPKIIKPRNYSNPHDNSFEPDNYTQDSDTDSSEKNEPVFEIVPPETNTNQKSRPMADECTDELNAKDCRNALGRKKMWESLPNFGEQN